jgi:hypothetical protein
VGKEDEKNSHHAATQGCSHQRTLAPSTLFLSLKGYAAARFELNFITSFHIMPFFTVAVTIERKRVHLTSREGVKKGSNQYHPPVLFFT